MLFHDLRIIYKILSGENTGKYHFCMKYWSVFVVLRISFVRKHSQYFGVPDTNSFFSIMKKEPTGQEDQIFAKISL